MDDTQGKEHYEVVGKSKLRIPEQVPLDAKYSGAVVSRTALNENDEDDPFAPVENNEDDDPFASKDDQDQASAPDDDDEPDLDIEGALGADVEDEEIDSEQAFGDSDEERFKSFVFRGSSNPRSKIKSDGGKDLGIGRKASSDESDNESETDLGSDVSMEDVDADSASDSEDGELSNESEQEESSTSPPDTNDHVQPSSKREQLKSLLASDTAAVASSLSRAVNTDASKGRAVRQQYTTFDRFLDCRIKLQKGFSAIDELETSKTTSEVNEEAADAYKRAEEGALKLYSTIDSIRETIINSQSQQSPRKRKRASPPTTKTSMSSIWDDLSQTESRSRSQRRSILDKWSNKIRASDPSQIGSTARSRLIDPSTTQQPAKLSAVLDTYLLTEQNKGAKLASPTAEDEGQPEPQSLSQNLKYDDTFFYQSLLRDLINSRAATNTNISGGSLLPGNNALPLKLHPSGNKAGSKSIDTRASKGRKIRYTVHEKLQNFMAAEGDAGRDTAQWTEAAKTEFFGSLMGQSRALDEDDYEEEDTAIVNGDGGAEVEALRLFRS